MDGRSKWSTSLFTWCTIFAWTYKHIHINEFSQVKGNDTIFALGNIVMMKLDTCHEGHPMMAQRDKQQGKLFGEKMVKLINKQKRTPFEYHDNGTMQTIGLNKAVVNLLKYHFSLFLLDLFGCLCIYFH